MKRLFFILIIICLSLMVFSQGSGEIFVEREILGSVLPGEELEVELTISFNIGSPGSVIVTEEIPVGWELVEAQPQANDFDGKKKWLLYGNKLKDGMKIKYTLKSPQTFNDAQEINGVWSTVSSEGFIDGDSLILESAPIVPEETVDYTILIIGAIVLIAIIVIAVVVVKKKKK